MNKKIYFDNNGTIIECNLDDFEYFSNMALNYETMINMNPSLGHMAALNEYLNSTKDDITLRRYKEITMTSESRNFLKILIDLKKKEKNFRNNGVTNEIAIKYNFYQNEYQEILDKSNKLSNEQARRLS